MLKSYRQLKPTTTVPDSEFGVFLPRAAATTVKAALIGADGAGKTSLLRKLAGVADPLNDEYLPQQSEDPVVNNERFVRVSGRGLPRFFFFERKNKRNQNRNTADIGLFSFFRIHSSCRSVSSNSNVLMSRLLNIKNEKK